MILYIIKGVDFMRNIVITIGREYGSGGHEIGKKIARKLNIPFYDKELMELSAKESGLSVEVIENNDETAMNSLLYSLSTGGYLMNSFINPTDMPLNDKLFIIQSKVIRKAAEEGSCVIVGRCADYVLRDRDDCINAFIYAPSDVKIKRISELYKLDERSAKIKIVKTDKKRANYYNYYSDKKWGKYTNYNICIDSSVVGIEKTAQLIADMATSRMGGEFED